MSCRPSRSASSIARPQRSLVAVHSTPYRHSASDDDGSGHWVGSWSDLLRFERAVTATSEAACPWPFAYAPRRAGVHGLGPSWRGPARSVLMALLMPFAPGAPRAVYFEGLSQLADATDEERTEFFVEVGRSRAGA